MALLTAEDVQARLKISRATLYRLTSRREIPFRKITAKTYRFDAEEIDRWLKERREGPTIEVPDQEGG